MGKTRSIPGGSRHFTGCVWLTDAQHPASLLQQTDGNPQFHEIAFEYLQNDLFPLSAKHLSSCHLRWKDAVPKLSPARPLKRQALSAETFPGRFLSFTTPLPRSSHPQGKGNDWQHPLGGSTKVRQPVGWWPDYYSGLAVCNALASSPPPERSECLGGPIPFGLLFEQFESIFLCQSGAPGTGCPSLPPPLQGGGSLSGRVCYEKCARCIVNTIKV